MSLNEAVLRKLAEWRPAANQRQTLFIPDEGSGWAVAVTADRCDELGCLAWELTMQRTGAAGGPASLRAWADAAARRVNTLMEPLKVVEVDVERNEALLRSNETVERGGDEFYYEVLQRGTAEAVVRRYQAARQPGQRRQQVLFPITHEALARAVADLAV